MTATPSGNGPGSSGPHLHRYKLAVSCSKAPDTLSANLSSILPPPPPWLAARRALRPPDALDEKGVGVGEADEYSHAAGPIVRKLSSA